MKGERISTLTTQCPTSKVIKYFQDKTVKENSQTTTGWVERMFIWWPKWCGCLGAGWRRRRATGGRKPCQYSLGTSMETLNWDRLAWVNQNLLPQVVGCSGFKELRAFPNKQKPTSKDYWGMLSFVYLARVQPEPSPYCHLGHRQWSCHIGGLLWT